MSSRPLRWGTLAGIAIGLLSLAATSSAATTSWTVVTAPTSVAGTNAMIEGASLRTDSDIWAVGAQFAAAGSATPPAMALHYNGTSWSDVPTPTVPNATSDGLSAVSASSTTDAWAVGIFQQPFTGYHGANSLYEHWNGTAWSIVSGPNAGPLVGVADLSPTDAVAVSSTGNAVQWNGTAWTTLAIPHPNPADTVGDKFVALSADSPTDIWAVGTFQSTTSSNLFALHYDGTSWTDVNLPLPAIGGVLLGISSVSAVSPTNVWVDGSGDGGSYVEHWNGTAWSEVALPTSGLFYPDLTTITARSASDVWAIGSEATNANGYPATLLFLHWNGSSWSTAASPTGTTYNWIYTAVAGSTKFWALGIDTADQPLAMTHS